MLKGLSNIKLIGLLAVLVLAYAGMQLFGNKGRSKAFKDTLVAINADAVDKLVITKGEEEIVVEKREMDWKVLLDEGKVVTALESKVNSSLSDLQSIKPNRIASRSEDKWSEYQVDSAGTRVQVFEDGKETLDIVLGRFGMKGQRQFFSYVRLNDEDEVYASDGFTGFSFPKTKSDFREKSLASFNRDSVTLFTFTYPMDSSYVLQKNAEQWMMNSEPTDSTSVASFLSGASRVFGSEFVDDITVSELGQPTFSVEINEEGKGATQISAYQHPIHKWLIHSSINEEALFADKDESLVQKIFKGKSELTISEE